MPRIETDGAMTKGMSVSQSYNSCEEAWIEMTTGSTDKTCVLCRQDCSGRPRVKDSRGRYYCRDCHDEAQRRREADRRALLESGGPTVDAPPDPAAILDAPPVVQRDDQPGTSDCLTDDVGAQTCPGCNGPLPLGTVVCLACGFNKQTGSQIAIASQSSTPGRKKARKSSGGSAVWPIPIGVFSILFGLMSGAFYILNAVGEGLVMQSVGGTGSPGGARIGRSILMIMLAAWLIWAGIGIIRRSASAVVLIRRWAKLKTGLTVLGALCLVAVLSFGGSLLQQVGGDVSTMDKNLLILGALLTTAFSLFWPIFVLIWFSRSSVEADVASWR